MTKQEVRQKLDEINTFSEHEVQSAVLAMAEIGAPIILHLSQIWSEGQVTESEFREENFGTMFLAYGVLLAIAGVVRFDGYRDYIVGAIAIAAASGSFIAGVKLRRRAAAKAKAAKRCAQLAGQIISNITDSQCALRMLEACYGLNGNNKNKLILVEPAASILSFLLPLADEQMFASPSRLARLSIRQILTKDWRTNVRLAKEVIDLIGRAGLTEFVADIDRLTKAWSLKTQAEECSCKLHEIIEERKRTGVLLRPSSGPEEPKAILLRPVSTSHHEHRQILVRAIQEEP